MREFLDYALQQLLIQATLGKLRKRAAKYRRVFLLAIVLAASVAARAADGDLDRSYGNDGIGIIRVDGRTAYSVGKPILLDDGKLLLGGVANFLPMQNVGSSIILRVNADGTLDQTFGAGGRIIDTTLVNLVGLKRLADGKIIAAGGSVSGGGGLSFAAARYNADGTLDTTFGSGGYALGARGAARAFAVQTDGKIVVAGFATLDADAGDDFLLARFAADGTIDTGFGAGGVASTDFYQGVDRVSSVTVQASGRIVAAGFANVPTRGLENEQRVDFALAGYDANGARDATFGTGGVSTAQFSRRNLAQIQNLTTQADGKIVVVGGHNAAGEGLAMARYKPDGNLDPTFDTDGKAVMDYPGLTSSIIFRDVTPERGGKMISVAAPTENAAQRDFFLLARCTRFGSADETLEGDGEVLIQLGTRTIASSVLTLPDGKTIVAGVTDGGFFTARFVAPRPAPNDFDGDGRADVGVFRPATGEWYLSNSSANPSTVRFGLGGDKLTRGDYDGDGRADLAVYRAGTWYILRSSDDRTSILQFGLEADVPVAGDYDGDARDDIAVFRPAEGNWYILRSSDAQVEITRFGLAEDTPTPADYDGDGRADIAVFRPSSGVWYRIDSRDGQVFIRQFGQPGDVPVAADYDGDGRSDLAVYRAGTWYIEASADGAAAVIQYGLSDDIPVPADYDGDARADLAVFRASDGDWYLLGSHGFESTVTHWGMRGDTPLAAVR